MRDYYDKGVNVIITGDDIHDNLYMPFVPRKGEILWLSSLTRGKYKEPEVLVSKVVWSMDQISGSINAWVHVRRVNKKEAKNGTV